MARGDFPSSKQDQFVVRFPEGLRDKIRVAAEQNGRSMNAEIVSRIEESLDPSLNKDEQLDMLYGYMDEAHKERSELIDAINRQERFLQILRDAHRTLSIMSRTIGELLLAEKDLSPTVKLMAEGLATVEMDLTPDASEPVPKEPWEE